jgi:uncharacterized membrane protein YcaP (DUF421 family)
VRHEPNAPLAVDQQITYAVLERDGTISVVPKLAA